MPPSKANEGRAPQIGPPEPVETGRAKSPETATKLWAVMAIDVENYVKTNVHVKTALDEFSRLPAEQREFFEKNVLGSLIDWQRILLHIGTSKDTEWDALMAVLLTALGEQDVTDSIDLIMRSSDCSDQMQPGCRDIGKRLRDRVKADIKCLQDSQYLPEMRKLKAFGPQGLPAGKVHVVCVSDERPLRGEALKERHSHIEHKLRDCAKAGLLTDEEVSEALLKQLVEKTWPDKSTDSKFPSRTFSDEDGIEYLSDVMAEAAEIEDRESQQYWEGVCEDFFVRFPEARDMKDEITHGEDALRYAMQDVVRRQIKRTAAETRNMDFISEAGVKADAIIHELSLRLVPKSLIVVSNDTDFFQVSWQAGSCQAFSDCISCNLQRRMKLFGNGYPNFKGCQAQPLLKRSHVIPYQYRAGLWKHVDEQPQSDGRLGSPSAFEEPAQKGKSWIGTFIRIDMAQQCYFGASFPGVEP